MSAMNSFNNTFFMSGPEGGILIAICIVAAVCTLAVIALAIIAVLALRRRKRENEGEVSEPAQKVQPPAEQAEQTEQTSAEVLAETSAEIPAELSEQTHTKVSSAIFAQGGVFYNKSFKAKLIQSGDKVKSWYAALKNELLSYKKVKARMSWKRESFRFGRKIIARFGYRGNILCIYLPLEPADYQGTKYKVEASDYAVYADTPCMYRIKNERRVRYAAELIAALMGSRGIERIERMAEDYYLPYEDAETLIKEGLIKVVNVPPRQIASWDAAEEVVEEIAAEATGEAAAEVSEEQSVKEVEVLAEEEPTEENAVEEEAGEEQSVEETEAEKETVTETPEENPVEEAEEVSGEQPIDEVEVATGEVAAAETIEEEPTEETITETEVEELSKRELDDVETYEEKTKDEDGIEVVGVMFRRRGRKVYWFDPDGKTWKKGEIAFYITPDVPPQEVIVVDNAKISPSKLHLPLKPLHKATRRPQINKK